MGQGDCSIFFIPNSKEAVVLDTGGSKYSDIAKNKIIPFLESKGINKINKIVIIFITHDMSYLTNSARQFFWTWKI